MDRQASGVTSTQEQISGHLDGRSLEILMDQAVERALCFSLFGIAGDQPAAAEIAPVPGEAAEADDAFFSALREQRK